MERSFHAVFCWVLESDSESLGEACVMPAAAAAVTPDNSNTAASAIGVCLFIWRSPVRNAPYEKRGPASGCFVKSGSCCVVLGRSLNKAFGPTQPAGIMLQVLATACGPPRHLPRADIW